MRPRQKKSQFCGTIFVSKEVGSKFLVIFGRLFEFFSIYIENHGYISESSIWFFRTVLITIMGLDPFLITAQHCLSHVKHTLDRRFSKIKELVLTLSCGSKNQRTNPKPQVLWLFFRENHQFFGIFWKSRTMGSFDSETWKQRFWNSENFQKKFGTWASLISQF